MRILAFEFSTLHRGVAVLDTETGRTGLAVQNEGRATPAFKLIREALDLAAIERGAIDCVAVGLGPGSYTGIRNAIALAQGWQLARAVRLAGFSSVEVLANELSAAGRRGRFRLVVDAQRGEFYASRWALDDRGPRELTPLEIVTRKHLLSTLEPGEILAGPDACRAGAEKPGAERVEEVFPRADRLARLAATRGGSVAGEALEPIYLRPVAFAKTSMPPNPLAGRPRSE